MIIKNVQACFDWDHGGDCFDTRRVIYKLCILGSHRISQKKDETSIHTK